VAEREKPLILVVDDQVTIIRIMTNMLKPQYDVCVALDGDKAIAVAISQQPDLILLDNLMPGKTGFEVCELLKKAPETAEIPVIFVTAMDDRHNEQIGFKVGAVDYINKPASPEVVLARVGVHLRNQRQDRFIKLVANGALDDPEKIKRAARTLLNQE